LQIDIQALAAGEFGDPSGGHFLAGTWVTGRKKGRVHTRDGDELPEDLNALGYGGHDGQRG
jgi:hypothetical protein